MSPYDEGYLHGYQEASAALQQVVEKMSARFRHHEEQHRKTIDNIDWALGLNQE